MPPFHERQTSRIAAAPRDLLSPLPPRQDRPPRPSANDVEALLRRREQRLDMLKSSGSGQVPLERPGVELDA